MPELSHQFIQQFKNKSNGRLSDDFMRCSTPICDAWQQLLSDSEFKKLFRNVFPPASSSSSSSSSSASNSEELHQELLAYVLKFVQMALGRKCHLAVRDTHSKNAPDEPYHRIDVSLVDKQSTSAVEDAKVSWNHLVCAVEIKSQIDAICVKQLCDSSSELFSSQGESREFAYGLAMSGIGVRLLKFSRAEPLLSCTQEVTLFSPVLPSTPSVGFTLLVNFLSQSFDTLGFHPFCESSQFVFFFGSHDHIRLHYVIEAMQANRSFSRKPLLFSIRLHKPSLPSSSSASSSAASSSVQNLISSDSVLLESLVLDTVRFPDVSPSTFRLSVVLTHESVSSSFRDVW